MINKELKENFIEFFKTAVPAVLVAWAVCTFLITNTVVPSGSMNDTIPTGSRIIGNRLYNELNRGDIVIFHSNHEKKDLIKRLIGLPGDVVEIIPDENGGYIKINGDIYEEDYLKEKMIVEEYQKFEVPEGKYFFLGDNRNESLDARYWEDPYIDKEDIMAVAILSLYPKLQTF